MRPKLFDPSAVVNDALSLFWAQGYEGTHMPELLDAMRLGKASFYNAFGSKHAVFLKALDAYFDAVDHVLTDVLSGCTDRTEAVSRLLNAILAAAKSPTGSRDEWRGCLIGNTALEMGAQHEDIRGHLGRGVRLLQRHFQKALSFPDHDRRVLHPDAIAGKALHAVAGIQGILVLAKAGLPDAEIMAAKSGLLASIVSTQNP